MRVSVKIILINSEGKFLALRRSSTHPTKPFTWDLPGGLMEEGEDIVESLRREVYEEAGISVEIEDLRIIDALSKNTADGHLISMCYRGNVSVVPSIILSYEHDQFLWVSREEFLALDSAQSLVRFITRL